MLKVVRTNNAPGAAVNKGIKTKVNLSLYRCLRERTDTLGGVNMKNSEMFLDSIVEQDRRERMEGILNYIREMFPYLKEEIKWSQPMFTDHGTFIIGFSVAKEHLSVAPDAVAISLFEKEIEAAGYSHTRELFRIKWTDKVDFDLIHKLVAFNIESKKDITTFWRK